MSDQLPSQAEGERDPDLPDGADPEDERERSGQDFPRRTPSQAEGERMDDRDDE
ncbi:hypothetical protein SAMN06297387_11033 [Streptomyces zhaozhouensis]|uniref:Uncharacterized protein n=1 Tax=Streptomyces zhaozhouensis TaxID=1300267 RepID=A0A286DXB0_9ACTN|nr:hypothetical protein [Streptomyces zhaozhouensis]SOD63301.1 hypothetical protein SAMN06297387_11033 [Streptomyces zhaozhouensis]